MKNPPIPMKRVILKTMWAGVLLVPSLLWAGQEVRIEPSTFDFGWAPDNAKITAQFVVKNIGSELVPLTAVQPSCGCTAADFTPSDIATEKEAKVALVFNTRGYTGNAFHKSTTIKAGSPETSYDVTLSGVVTDPAALVLPEGTGIAEFPKGTHETTKNVSIKNKSDKAVSIKLVQAPAPWATVELADADLAAGATVQMIVNVDKTDDSKETSATFEATGDAEPSRFTVAIRTGDGPDAPRRVRPVSVPKKNVDKITPPAKKPAIPKPSVVK